VNAVSVLQYGNSVRKFNQLISVKCFVSVVDDNFATNFHILYVSVETSVHFNVIKLSILSLSRIGRT